MSVHSQASDIFMSSHGTQEKDYDLKLLERTCDVGHLINIVLIISSNKI